MKTGNISFLSEPAEAGQQAHGQQAEQGGGADGGESCAKTPDFAAPAQKHGGQSGGDQRGERHGQGHDQSLPVRGKGQRHGLEQGGKEQRDGKCLKPHAGQRGEVRGQAHERQSQGMQDKPPRQHHIGIFPVRHHATDNHGGGGKNTGRRNSDIGPAGLKWASCTR